MCLLHANTIYPPQQTFFLHNLLDNLIKKTIETGKVNKFSEMQKIKDQLHFRWRKETQMLAASNKNLVEFLSIQLQIQTTLSFSSPQKQT